MGTDTPAAPLERPLAGNVAIISGGIGDIGRATAMELARRGADVAMGDVRPTEQAQPLLQELRQLGARARYDRVDVADAPAVRQWVRSVEAQLGVPTLVIANAAIVTVASVRDITPEQWSTELRINLDGAFHLAQAAAVRMLEQHRQGRIVFVGSWAAHAPHPTIPAYCAAKAAMRMLCKCMALELAPHGILVNEVAPGYVDAGLSGRMFEQNPALRQSAIAHVPIRRLITPQDVARQIAYLCDPLNNQMTGSVLLMDGGLSLVGPKPADA
ncbi:SDR family NAD(P)-dependent oxidoreductase [Fontivita pretiosa]|uniref:SDR family NAD(P)-dependent oxidoreductase n=1 Tax=Fontivita pretiosa TaxID=2989684 RepID=UPI003D17DB0E